MPYYYRTLKCKQSLVYFLFELLYISITNHNSFTSNKSFATLEFPLIFPVRYTERTKCKQGITIPPRSLRRLSSHSVALLHTHTHTHTHTHISFRSIFSCSLSLASYTHTQREPRAIRTYTYNSSQHYLYPTSRRASEGGIISRVRSQFLSSMYMYT